MNRAREAQRELNLKRLLIILQNTHAEIALWEAALLEIRRSLREMPFKKKKYANAMILERPKWDFKSFLTLPVIERSNSRHSQTNR